VVHGLIDDCSYFVTNTNRLQLMDWGD